MSDYAEAVRELLEPDLFCTCGAMNSPTKRTIRVDVNGVASCGQCGRGGDLAVFQPPNGTRHGPRVASPASGAAYARAHGGVRLGNEPRSFPTKG